MSMSESEESLPSKKSTKQRVQEFSDQHGVPGLAYFSRAPFNLAECKILTYVLNAKHGISRYGLREEHGLTRRETGTYVLRLIRQGFIEEHRRPQDLSPKLFPTNWLVDIACGEA
jgi:hypothetical protein